MSSFAFLKPANQLWKDAKIAKVRDRILGRITELPAEICANRHSMELLSLICNMIENSGIKNKEENRAKLDAQESRIQCLEELVSNLTKP